MTLRDLEAGKLAQGDADADADTLAVTLGEVEAETLAEVEAETLGETLATGDADADTPLAK